MVSPGVWVWEEVSGPSPWRARIADGPKQVALDFTGAGFWGYAAGFRLQTFQVLECRLDPDATGPALFLYPGKGVLASVPDESGEKVATECVFLLVFRHEATQRKLHAVLAYCGPATGSVVFTLLPVYLASRSARANDVSCICTMSEFPIAKVLVSPSPRLLQSLALQELVYLVEGWFGAEATSQIALHTPQPTGRKKRRAAAAAPAANPTSTVAGAIRVTRSLSASAESNVLARNRRLALEVQVHVESLAQSSLAHDQDPTGGCKRPKCVSKVKEASQAKSTATKLTTATLTKLREALKCEKANHKVTKLAMKHSQGQVREQEDSLALQDQVAQLQEHQDDLKALLADKKAALATAVSALANERDQRALLQREKDTLSTKLVEATLSLKHLQDDHTSKTISLDMFDKIVDRTGQFGAEALKEVSLGAQDNVKNALALLCNKDRQEMELAQMKLRLADSERNKKETINVEHVKMMMEMVAKKE